MSRELLDRIDRANQAVYAETARRSGGVIETIGDFVCILGVHPSPIIANVVFRPPFTNSAESHSIRSTLTQIVDRYEATGNGVSLLSAQHRDAELEHVVSSLGWESVIELPGMLLRARLAEPDPTPDLSFEWIDPVRDLGMFREVLQGGFADDDDERGMIAAVFAEPASLVPPGIRAIIAFVDGAPASCGVAYEGAGLGAIGWVATLPSYRRRGLGTIVTTMAVNALFDAGATGVTLQASPDGLPLYVRMGFEEFTRYQIWMPRR